MTKEKFIANTVEEFYDFLRDSWNVPVTAKVNEEVVCHLANDEYELGISDEYYELTKKGMGPYWLTLDPEDWRADYEMYDGDGNPIWSGIREFCDKFNEGYFVFCTTFTNEGTYPLNLYIIDDTAPDSLYPYNDSMVDYIILEGGVITVTKNIIATATTLVKNGKSTTNTLQYKGTHNPDSFTPGKTYTINAEYPENEHYTQTHGIAELTIQKTPTQTQLNIPSTIDIGDTVTATVTVTEQKNNTTLTEGYVTIYDGNEIVQQNYTLTGNSTQITFTPATVGNHEIRAVFSDNGTRYAQSTSKSTLVITKLTTTLTCNYNTIRGVIDDKVTLSGNLSDKHGNIIDGVVRLYEYDGTLLGVANTNEYGNYSINYTFVGNSNGQSILLTYDGNSTRDSTSKTVDVELYKHDVNISVPDIINGYTDSTLTVPVSLTDEDGNKVTSGELEVTLTRITEDETGGGGEIMTPDLIPKSRVKITDYNIEYYIKFIDAKVYVENDTPLYLDVHLCIVNGEDEIEQAPGSNEDNIIRGLTDTQYTLTLPTGFTDYHYSNGEIGLSEERSDVIPSLLDTENGTITLTGTSETYGGTPLSWTVTGEYTVEEVD